VNGRSVIPAMPLRANSELKAATSGHDCRYSFSVEQDPDPDHNETGKDESMMRSHMERRED
jgi:hypothetical protein